MTYDGKPLSPAALEAERYEEFFQLRLAELSLKAEPKSEPRPSPPAHSAYVTSKELDDRCEVIGAFLASHIRRSSGGSPSSTRASG